MKKKLAAPVFAAVMLLTLTACGQKSPAHEHVWQEASCLTPKTCIDCGETEGEALGHSPTEATHWAPSVCSVCGEELSKALIPDFEKYGFHVIDVSEMPTENVLSVDEKKTIVSTGLRYQTSPAETSSLTVGYVALKNREIFQEDEGHPAADGYEWRSYQFELLFPQWLSSDGSRQQYNYRISFSDDDYYDIAARDDSARGLHYTVTWQGEEYADCMRIVSYSFDGTEQITIEYHQNNIYIPVWKHSCYVWVRVPVGYDGAIFAFKDARNELSPGMHIYDLPEYTTDNALFIRLS